MVQRQPAPTRVKDPEMSGEVIAEAEVGER